MTSHHGTAPAPGPRPVRLAPEPIEGPVGAHTHFRSQEGLPRVVLPGLMTPTRLVTRYADPSAVRARVRT